MVIQKLVGVLILLVIIFVFALVRPVAAHQLQTDGNMRALLHIEPDDNPVEGKPLSFILYFQPQAGQFTLNGCDCQLALSQNGQTVYPHALTATSPTISDNQYTFDRDGNYTLTVTGTPKQPGAFDAFKLTYDIRTGPATGDASGFKINATTVTALILLQALILLGLYNFLRP